MSLSSLEKSGTRTFSKDFPRLLTLKGSWMSNEHLLMSDQVKTFYGDSCPSAL